MKKWSVWPLGIFISYSVFAVVLVAVLIIASSDSVDLVSENYYVEGLKYQDQIDRINRAKTVNKAVRFQLDKTNRLIRIHFDQYFEPGGVSGFIELFRPANAAEDKQLKIVLSKNGTQEIPISSLSSGMWKLKIGWEYQNQEYYHEDILVIPNPVEK